MIQHHAYLTLDPEPPSSSQNMDLVQKEKQDSWKTFQTGKGSKKKPGFLTGTKKESIFASSEQGKVGVIGSGKVRGAVERFSRRLFFTPLSRLILRCPCCDDDGPKVILSCVSLSQGMTEYQKAGKHQFHVDE